MIIFYSMIFQFKKVSLRGVLAVTKLQLQNLLLLKKRIYLYIQYIFSQNAHYLVKTAFFFLCRELGFFSMCI